MRVAAVPIIPAKKMFPNPSKMKKVIRNTGRATAKAIFVDYQVTMQTWSTKAEFKIEEKSWYEWIISTNSDIYRFVNDGTRPHTIRARNKPNLVFQWGGPGSYQAKTTPRIIASRSGGPSGPVVYRQEVMHPGTQARNFDVVISEKWQKEWPRQLSRAIASEF